MATTRIYSSDEKKVLQEQGEYMTLIGPASTRTKADLGHVYFYTGSENDPKYLDEIVYTDYIAGQHNRLPTKLYDYITTVVWNLPIGIAMTFTDDAPDQAKGANPADLSYAASTFDLIGSGFSQAASLFGIHMSYNASMFFWREIDLLQGAVECWHDKNFGGNRTTIFLSDWPREEIVDIGDWSIADSVSSIRWQSLNDRQMVTLYQNRDGSGSQYGNIKGWGSFKEVSNMADVGFDETVSAFSWTTIPPKKEIIEPITIKIPDSADATTLTNSVEGDNDSEMAQKTTVTLNKEEGQDVTVETSDQHHAGMSVKTTASTKEGVEGVADVEFSLELGLSYDFTKTKTVTTSTSSKIAVAVEQEFNVQPHCHYVASIVVSIGKMPATDYETKVTRWYDYPVLNGTQDSSNNNWYKREEKVLFRVSGSLMCKTVVNVKATPL